MNETEKQNDVIRCVIRESNEQDIEIEIAHLMKGHEEKDKEVMPMVTYADMFIFVTMLCDVITIVVTIAR